jgi:hypothetical protein
MESDAAAGSREEGGVGALSLALSDVAAISYSVSVSKQGIVCAGAVFDAPAPHATISIAPGTYDIAVQAFDASSNAIAAGRATSVQVRKNETTEVNLVMTTLATGGKDKLDDSPPAPELTLEPTPAPTPEPTPAPNAPSDSGPAPGGGGPTYHVGPDQQYTTIGSVPWSTLGPGSTVYIHYQPTPYYEKFLISTAGTPSQWIRVLGVLGPNGERPVISGNSAVTSKNNHYRWQDPKLIQWDGVIQIASNADSDELPAYVEIANLQVQDGYKSYKFTAENGALTNYEGFAACIYARSAKHVLIRDNVLTNCGQGFYNWTGDGSAGGTTYWEGTQIDTVIRNNAIYGNGNTNSYTEHQIYTESDGVIIEYNRFGPQRSGALGSQVKDRSSGTIVRYNYIEQSPAGWDIDLVEPQESFPVNGTKSSYKQAFVYGNTIVNKGVYDPSMIHWNEDHMAGQGRATVAGGKLFFYNNTVVTVANESDMGYAASFSVFNETWGGFECPTGNLPGTIDVRNNIFAVIPRTSGSAVPQLKFGYCSFETFDFGANWVSPGWTVGTAGGATGTASIVSPAANDPGFVSLSTNDYRLTATSSAHGLGGALAPEVTSNVLGLDLRPSPQGSYVGAFPPL